MFCGVECTRNVKGPPPFFGVDHWNSTEHESGDSLLNDYWSVVIVVPFNSNIRGASITIWAYQAMICAINDYWLLISHAKQSNTWQSIAVNEATTRTENSSYWSVTVSPICKHHQPSSTNYCSIYSSVASRTGVMKWTVFDQDPVVIRTVYLSWAYATNGHVSLWQFPDPDYGFVLEIGFAALGPWLTQNRIYTWNLWDPYYPSRRA